MEQTLSELYNSLSFNGVVLWLLSLGTVIFILDASGLLPRWAAKWLLRNKLDSTIRALQMLGVKVTWDADKAPQRNRIAIAVSRISRKAPQYQAQLNRLLESHTLKGQVIIGQRRSFTAESFIDVMGNTTDPKMAKNYAQLLHTYLHEENLLDFDVIATPKDGSPFLGYELASIVEKPLVLGVSNKGEDPHGQHGGHMSLDFSVNELLEHRKIMLVDDSTTGGRKMVKLAETLREQGAIVTTAAVLFEPIGKGARQALKHQGIELHAVVKGPQGRI